MSHVVKAFYGRWYWVGKNSLVALPEDQPPVRGITLKFGSAVYNTYKKALGAMT